MQLADYNELVSNTYIDLYERGGVAAWQRFTTSWQRARQFTRIQFFGIETTFLRGCMALGARNELRDAHAIAERCAKRLARIGTKFSKMLATQLRAAIATERGERDTAAWLLRDAIRDAEAIDTTGYAMAARIRLGDVVDDADARAQASEAESFFRAQGVVAPRRFANLLAPGLGN